MKKILIGSGLLTGSILGGWLYYKSRCRSN